MRALALLLVVGCGPVQYPGPAEATLGTGYTAFVPIADGDSVPIVMGLQGGYHVWGSVRARWLDPSQVHLHFTITRTSDGARQAERDDNIALDGGGDGLDWGQHLGSAVIFTDVAQARGQPCRFHLDLSDRNGRTAVVERSITPM